jgi:hypothetical protein
MRPAKRRKYPRYSTGERLSFIQWSDRSFATTSGSVTNMNAVASARSPGIEGFVHVREIEGDVDVNTKEKEAPDDDCEKEENMNAVASARSPGIEGFVRVREIEGDVDVNTKEKEAPDDDCEKEEEMIASIYLTRYVNKSCHKEKEPTSRPYCRMIESTEVGCAAGVKEENKEHA